MKEREIDEMAKKIELKNNNIKALETEINSETELLNRKKINKAKLEEECLNHEIRNRNRLKKLEAIKNILNGNEYSYSDFKIDPEEIKEFIAETPLQGVTKINESLLELKGVLEGSKEDETIKREYNYVTIKYLADNFKIIIPEDPLYSFKDLLKEACDFFRLKNSETSSYYILKDDYDTWPINAYVNDYFLNNPNSELILVLQSNPYSKSKHKHETQIKYKKDDLLTKIVTKIKDVLERKDDSGNVINENFKDNKIAKLSMMKAVRENEIIILIEKTFGKRICYLLFYILFLIFILTFIISKNNVAAPIQLLKVINNEFVKQTFMVNFTLFDFFTKDRNNDFNVNNYTYYQVETTLEEINDIRLLAPYLETVYFPTLSFDTNLFNFIEKHMIVGPIRFYQLREATDPNCTAVSFYVSPWTEVEKYYCYGPYSTNSTNNNFYNFNGLTDAEKIIVKDCENNLASTSPVCALINQGKVYRASNMSYSYTGAYNTYDFSSGYYFDITPSNITSASDIQIFSKFVAYYWIDLSTRLISISFNAYKATNADNSLISITLYLETDSAQKIIKNFDVKIFTLFINFEYLFTQIETLGFKMSEVFASISKNFKEYFYLLLLIIYSSWNLKSQLGRLFKEGFMSIFYKNFVQWVVDISISGLILGVVVIRIAYIIIQTQHVMQFKKSGFTSFFCVNYFTENWEGIVNLLEIFMVMCITINALNAFYYEFFARIFLTFKKASTLMFSFLIFYMTLNLAFAACFYIMYGQDIQSKIIKSILDFSTLFQSITTMILFVYTDFAIINKMIVLSPILSWILLFSYYYMVYIILLNQIFVIFLDAYERVIKNHVLTLLKYSLLWDGLVQFFNNWVLIIVQGTANLKNMIIRKRKNKKK